MLTLRKTTTAFAAAAFALALALLLGVLAVSKPASASPDVTPKSVDGNKTCVDLGLGNYEFKLEGSQLKNGTYTDPNNGGYLTVQLSNSVITSNELKSFDWASNIGVDAVIVKGGTGENAYVYDPPGPESKGDDKLVAPEGKGVSHISFCYDFELKVSKDAQTSLTRTHDWSIDKSVTPGTLDLFRGDSGDANYTVKATKDGSTDSNWAVKGTITVSNPNPFTVAVGQVVDEVTGLPATPVECKNASGDTVAASYQLKPGEQLSCPYSFNLSDASKRLNTARAIPTPLPGTPIVQPGRGTADVDFSQATITEKNTSINVNDDLGTPDDESDDKTFPFSGNGGSADPYKLTFSCDEDSGTHTNTASATILNPDGTNKVVSDNASVTVNCHELAVSKTADTSFTRTQNWDIEKTVNPETLDLFRGDSGEAEYTVKATNTGFDDSDHEVSGTITINNPAPIAAPLAGVTDALEDGTAATGVDCGGAQSVPANGQLQCSYSIDLNAPTDSTNIATAALQNNTGTTTSFTGEANVDFGQATITPVNDSISVKDSFSGFGDPRTFSDDGSVSYDRTFDCNDGSKTYENVATIEQTGQSDDASVKVNCHTLSVSKDAKTSFTRTHSWDIDKSADKSELTLSPGQQFLVNYSVKVSSTSKDGDYAVSGKITVNNTTPIDANLKSVADQIEGINSSATVDCGVSFPYTLKAGESLNCSYNSGLPNNDTRTNTATATLANNTGFSGTANVDFGNAAMTEIDEEITVTDAFNGGSPDTLGVVKANEAPKTFDYTRSITSTDAKGDPPAVTNVAKFVTNDTKTPGSDSWTIKVNASDKGCTLTVGYWKNHAGAASGSSGNQADMVTKHLPISLGTSGAKKSVKVTTATQAVSLLTKVDSSNGIEKLYAQLLAAKLNIKNGADGSAVAGTISDADAFLATRNAADWSKLTKTDQQKVIDWAKKLDQYNNGEIGPGHCNE